MLSNANDRNGHNTNTSPLSKVEPHITIWRSSNCSNPCRSEHLQSNVTPTDWLHIGKWVGSISHSKVYLLLLHSGISELYSGEWRMIFQSMTQSVNDYDVAEWSHQLQLQLHRFDVDYTMYRTDILHIDCTQ